MHHFFGKYAITPRQKQFISIDMTEVYSVEIRPICGIMCVVTVNVTDYA